MRPKSTKLFATLLVAAFLLAGFGISPPLSGSDVPVPHPVETETAVFSNHSDAHVPSVSIIGPTHVLPYTRTTYTAHIPGLEEGHELDYEYEWEKQPVDITSDAPVAQHFCTTTGSAGADFTLSVVATHKETGESASDMIQVQVSNDGEQGRCVGPPYPCICEDFTQ